MILNSFEILSLYVNVLDNWTDVYVGSQGKVRINYGSDQLQ